MGFSGGGLFLGLGKMLQLCLGPRRAPVRELAAGVKAGAIVKWLKEDFGLGHGHAMAIVALLKGMKCEDSD